MKAETVRIPETAFISTERFNQKAFKRWVEKRPARDVNRYELAHGKIVRIPPAGWGHGEVEAKVSAVLGEFVYSHKLGKVFGSSTGYDLPSGDTLEPDASLISAERWAKGPQVGASQFLRIVPNLVLEILSPATAQRDRVEKKKIYQINGVDEYWLIDPDRREVTVFQLVQGKYGAGKRFRANQNVRSSLLSDLSIPTRSLFA
jgi:Uma2 family endonuclease